MSPKLKDNRPDTEPVASADMADIDTNMILKIISLLEDNRITKKLQAILFPQDLVKKIYTLHQELANLSAQLSDKNDKIVHLENRVETLEDKLDSMQQYSRRQKSPH
ncbi:hypothetical protein LSAT2_032844, partial [Lamellibrachia satsuma]